ERRIPFSFLTITPIIIRIVKLGIRQVRPSLTLAIPALLPWTRSSSLRKMALLGYLYGITSERKLAEECRLNLAFMWFLGYDLDEMPPDHSILSKARARFGREVYEQFFRHVVRLYQEAGLVEGEKVFIDATLLQANAYLNFVVEREVYHQLTITPEEYLDRVWKENPLEGPEDLDRSNFQARTSHRGKRLARNLQGKTGRLTRSG
ncbi:transposase, partial [Moorellaceae bacterium AZ2]